MSRRILTEPQDPSEMSNITNLPTEVLEHILLYLNQDDIYSWKEAIDAELSDSFWKRICLRDRVVDEEEILDDTNWREEYFAFLNWKTGNYDHRYFPCADQPDRIHRSNILIPSGGKFCVCNIKNVPRFLDDFPTKKSYTFGPFIVLVRGDVLDIYRYSDMRYSHFKSLTVQNRKIATCDKNNEPKFKHEIAVAMNENYLVIYQHKFKLLSILNLRDNEPKHFDTDCSFLFGLSILSNTVHTLLLKCNKYILNRYKLPTDVSEESVIISQNAAGILVPKLKYNDTIIVSLISFFVCSHNTLKIMNRHGEELKTIHIDADFTWFCLVNGYVIYPTTPSVISVWNYDEPETTGEIEVEKGFKNGSTAAGCVLIMVYDHCLDVYSYNDCRKLYRIKFDEPKLTPLFSRWYCVLSGSQFECLYIFDFKKGRRVTEKSECSAVN